MKKVLSIVMACLMLAVLMVPAFAVTDTTGGDSEIITKTTKDDGTDGRSWEVTYPASTEIAWNALATEISYSAKAHLAYGEKLTVAVAASDSSKMVLAADDTCAIAYALTAEDLVIGPVAEGENTFTVDIAQAEWDAAPVGAYSDLLTFTATVA